MIILLGVFAVILLLAMVGSKESVRCDNYMWCFVIDVLALVFVYVFR